MGVEQPAGTPEQKPASGEQQAEKPVEGKPAEKPAAKAEGRKAEAAVVDEVAGIKTKLGELAEFVGFGKPAEKPAGGERPFYDPWGVY